MTTYSRERYLSHREQQIQWSKNYYEAKKKLRRKYAKKHRDKIRKLQADHITRYGVPWIIYEDLMVRENYGKIGDLELSKILGRTVHAIIARRNKLFNNPIRKIYGIRKYRV